MSLRYNTVSSTSSGYSLFPTGTASPNAFGMWGHDVRETYEQGAYLRSVLGSSRAANDPAQSKPTSGKGLRRIKSWFAHAH